MRNRWTYEECKMESLKCKTRQELKSRNTSVFNKINREKWYDLYEHMEIVGNKYNRLIYVYEFSDNNCYIGLTGDINRRNNQHLYTDLNSPVYKHVLKTGLYPKLVILTDYIDHQISSIKEGEVASEYKENGWILLNKIKTGNLGGSQIKWTLEKCKEEAMKYNKMYDFIISSSGAYAACVKNKWIPELTNLTKRVRKNDYYWNNKEVSFEEMSKYSTKTEFCKKNLTAWQFAKINGWVDEFFGNGNSSRSGIFSRKPVTQYDRQMNKICDYISAAEAGRILNLCPSNIASVCRGKQKSYKGFIFRYKDK